MQLRRACLSDAAALSALAKECFRETFTHYTPEALEAYLDGDSSEDFFVKQLEDSSAEIWLIEVGCKLAGYAKWGKYKLPLPTRLKNPIELHRLYVLKAFQGQKIGKQFMGLFFDYAARKNADGLYLGVWSENLKAQQFYKHYGFEKAGEYNYPPIGEVMDREWIMVREM